MVVVVVVVVAEVVLAVEGAAAAEAGGGGAAGASVGGGWTTTVPGGAAGTVTGGPGATGAAVIGGSTVVGTVAALVAGAAVERAGRSAETFDSSPLVTTAAAMTPPAIAMTLHTTTAAFWSARTAQPTFVQVPQLSDVKPMSLASMVTVWAPPVDAPFWITSSSVPPNPLSRAQKHARFGFAFDAPGLVYTPGATSSPTL